MINAWAFTITNIRFQIPFFWREITSFEYCRVVICNERHDQRKRHWNWWCRLEGGKVSEYTSWFDRYANWKKLIMISGREGIGRWKNEANISGAFPIRQMRERKLFVRKHGEDQKNELREVKNGRKYLKIWDKVALTTIAIDVTFLHQIPHQIN